MDRKINDPTKAQLMYFLKILELNTSARFSFSTLIGIGRGGQIILPWEGMKLIF